MSHNSSFVLPDEESATGERKEIRLEPSEVPRRPFSKLSVDRLYGCFTVTVPLVVYHDLCLIILMQTNLLLGLSWGRKLKKHFTHR